MLLLGGLTVSAPALAIQHIKVLESQLANCSSDSECIVVPYIHCCGRTKRAINRKHRQIYEATKAWQSFQEPETCELMAKCPDDSAVTKAICEKKQCQLKF